ncbi:MAG: DUF4834 family protein [Prevotella sp.]
MATFLSFIFYLFLSGLIFIGMILFILYRRVKNVTNMFNKQRHSTQQQERRRTYRSDSGETVVDYRNPQETDRKIFRKEEGEYVDYEEEK